MRILSILVKIIRYRLLSYPKKEFIFDSLILIKFMYNFLLFRNKLIDNINDFELRVFSQNGEDGILQIIFHKIGTTNNYYVEFGAEKGLECNTRFLKEVNKWSGLWMDGRYSGNGVKKEFITKDNVEIIFNKYKVPKTFDLLSIDIDGNDYWIWKAIEKYKPRVIVIEYNSMYPPPESRTIVYEKYFKSEGTDYFGASLFALVKLANDKGYDLIGCENRGINAFFVKKEFIKGNFVLKPVKALFKPPNFGIIKKEKYTGYKKDKRRMIKV